MEVITLRRLYTEDKPTSRMTMTMAKTLMTRSPTMTVLWVVLTLCVTGLAAPVYHPRGPQDQPEKPKGRFPSDTGAGKAPRKEPTVKIYDHPNFGDVDPAEGGNQTGDDRGVTSPEQDRPAPDLLLLLLLTTPSPFPATTTTTTTTADAAPTTPGGTGTPTPEAEVGTTHAGNDTRNREAEMAHDGTDVKKKAGSQSTKLILVSVLVPVCIVLVVVGVVCWMVRVRIADSRDSYDGQQAVRGSSTDMLAMSSLIYGGADIDPFGSRFVHT